MPKFGPDEELVRRLSALLSETGLSEIEYEAKGERIRVAKGGGLTTNSAAPVATPAPDRPPGERAEGEAVPAGAVVAPMVGTAYLAAEPGAPSFVSVGDEVREGQTLLIIEAMKVMNQIPSPRNGRVTRVMVEDGQPVEFGEPLLVIE
ncbi:MAG: acetyl-CoA carboxylase, biotin carboxyl carrier protein [Kiloniellales bacterium]|nr:acetyl-CoA carboxylase, biotin carboxyl carrier protein [Kiloniellales bacterium]